MAMSINQIKNALTHINAKALLNEINERLVAMNGENVRKVTYYQMRQLRAGDGNVAAYAKDVLSDYFEGKLEAE